MNMLIKYVNNDYILSMGYSKKLEDIKINKRLNRRIVLLVPITIIILMVPIITSFILKDGVDEKIIIVMGVTKDVLYGLILGFLYYRLLKSNVQKNTLSIYPPDYRTVSVLQIILIFLLGFCMKLGTPVPLLVAYIYKDIYITYLLKKRNMKLNFAT